MRFLLDRLKEKSTITSVFGVVAMCGVSVSPEIVGATTEAVPQIVAGTTLLLTALLPEKTVAK